MKFLFSNFPESPVISSPWRYSLIDVPSSNTLKLRSCCGVRDQVSRPHNIDCNIITPIILVFLFTNTNDNRSIATIYFFFGKWLVQNYE
jgi:hypothetical protein